MTFKDLLKAARLALRDTVGLVDSDFSLTQEEALLYFNEAEQEACRRARLLTDSSTTAICSIAVTAGNALYSLDSRVLKVRRVKWSDADKPLSRISWKDLDANLAGWESHAGSVSGYITDFQKRKLRLYRTPEVNGTLALTVTRLPLADMAGLNDEPEIDLHLHIKLVPWVVYRKRSVEDTEMYDPRKAAAALADFEREFGPATTALQESFDETQPYDEYTGDW
jgi:hypothetical protein